MLPLYSIMNQNGFQRKQRLVQMRGKHKSHLIGFTEMTMGHALTKASRGLVQAPIQLNCSISPLMPYNHQRKLIKK